MSQPPIPPSPPLSRPTNPLLLLGLPVLAVLIAGAALYVALIRVPAQRDLQSQQDLLLRLTGVTGSATNKLDPAYADADGDLLADAPTDPAKLVDPPVLRLTYIATDDPEVYQAAFKPFVDHLAKVTGKKVEYVPLRGVGDELRGLRDGTLHLVAFNTGNVPRAVNVAGFHPFAAVAGADGNAFIKSVIIAPTSSSVKQMADLRGRELTVTDAGSNTGYRVPLALLKAQGLLAIRDFGLRYSGGHTESIQLVAQGRTEAAAVASDVLDRERAAGNIKDTQFVKLIESGQFPAGTFGLPHNLAPALAAKIREATLSFDWKGTPLESELSPAGGKFVPIDYKKDFALVRKIDDDTGNIHRLEP